MRSSQVYEGFIQFQEQSAAIYLELSIRFINDSDLSWFWVEMAMKDKQHAGLLQYCRETGICPPQLPTTDQILHLKKLLEDIQTRITETQFDIDTAFEIAMVLETSEIRAICKRLTAPIEGPEHILRKKIDVSLGNHLEKLAEAARRFGASPWIQERFVKLSSHASEEQPGC